MLILILLVYQSVSGLSVNFTDRQIQDEFAMIVRGTEKKVMGTCNAVKRKNGIMKMEKWFNNLVETYRDDLEYRTEAAILEFNEKVVAQ